MLTELGAEGTTLSVEQVAAAGDALAKAPYNGDGVLPSSAVGDLELKALIDEIVGATGGSPDRGGDTGVNQAQVDAFFADIDAVLAWSGSAPDAGPYGDGVVGAADAVKAVRAKVNDFFGRCRLAAFDDRAISALNRKEEEYLAIAAEDLTVTAEEVSGFPLARVAADRPLPLVQGVNPAWACALKDLQAAAVKPLLGDLSELTEGQWTEVQAGLVSFEAWRAARPASKVADLSTDRLEAIKAGPLKAQLTAQIEVDAAVAPDVSALHQVERLVRFHRDLYSLAQNFVNFTHFYSDTDRASFEAGTLFLDERACELVVRVDDPGKHAALAGRSKLFLAYCDCTRPSGEKMAIAAAFTDGDSDYLMVGRNGVFYDREGRDWDATITKIVDNPISLRQAFWSPYKKLARFFEDRTAKQAADKAAAADKKATEQAGAPSRSDWAPLAAWPWPSSATSPASLPCPSGSSVWSSRRSSWRSLHPRS